MEYVPLHAIVKTYPKKIRVAGGFREAKRRINEIIEMLPSFRLRPTANTQVQVTATGQTVKVAQPQKASAITGMVFRGEYDPTATDYAKNHVVVVRGTLTGGTYIAIATPPVGVFPADPPVNPADGIFWVALARDVGGATW